MSLAFLHWSLLSAIALNLAASPAHAANAADLRRAAELRAAASAESSATARLAVLSSAAISDSLAVAESWLELAVARVALTKDQDSLGCEAASRSIEILERRLPGSGEMLATAHEALASLLRRGDSDEENESHLRRAIALREASPVADDSLLADDLIRLANLKKNLGDFQTHRELLERALVIQRGLWGADHPDIAATLTHLSFSADHFGDLEKARSLCQEAEAIFQRLHLLNHPRRQFTLLMLSNFIWGGAATSEALDLRREALRVSREAFGEESAEAAAALHNLAGLLMGFGDYEGGRAAFEQFLPLAEQTYGPRHSFTALARLSVGMACVLIGDTARAIQLLRETEEAFESGVRDPGPGLTQALQYQARVRLDQGRYPEAVDLARRSLAVNYRRTSPNAWAILQSELTLIKALEALGDTLGLSGSVETLATLASDPFFGSGTWGADLSYGRARAARGLGRLEETRLFALVADSLAREALRLDARILPDRMALQLAQRRGTYLDFVVEMESPGPPDRWPVAWDRVIRWRGLVRAEMVSRRLPLALRSDTLVAKTHALWVQSERRLAQSLVDLAAGPRDSAASADAAAARSAAEDAESDYAKALRDRGERQPVSDVGLDEVRARLTASQALVSFFECRTTRKASRLIAFLASPQAGEVDCIDLGEADSIRTAVEDWHRQLADPPGSGADPERRAERECRRLGERVKSMVWDPVTARLTGIAELCLVEDGPVTDLAWHALPVGAHGYLVEEGPHVRVLSAERELCGPRVAGADRSLLAVGGPDFDRGHSGAGEVLVAALRGDADICASSSRPRFASLPGAAAEVQDIARLWGSVPGHDDTTLVGAQASEETFKRLAPGRSVLHVATHGFVTGDSCFRATQGLRAVGGVSPISQKPPVAKSQESPLPASRPAPSPWLGRRVWLALAGANNAGARGGGENDGLLTAEEVITLDLTGTDWVVLSACHSALTREWSGEGTSSMRNAFALAGAGSVIASHWAVGDESTREWMAELYRARARGASASATIAAADAAVLAARRAAGRSTHPFHWASFSASGD